MFFSETTAESIPALASLPPPVVSFVLTLLGQMSPEDVENPYAVSADAAYRRALTSSAVDAYRRAISEKPFDAVAFVEYVYITKRFTEEERQKEGACRIAFALAAATWRQMKSREAR